MEMQQLPIRQNQPQEKTPAQQGYYYLFKAQQGSTAGCCMQKRGIFQTLWRVNAGKELCIVSEQLHALITAPYASQLQEARSLLKSCVQQCSVDRSVDTYL